MSSLEFAFLEAPNFFPQLLHLFFLLLWKYTKLHIYISGLKSFRPTLFQQIFHKLLLCIFTLFCKTINLSPCLLLFAFSYIHKHVKKKAMAYAIALILTFKGKTSCRTKTLCSPDQSLTLFSASSISKCQTSFANVSFISAHAKLFPNFIP